MAHRFSVRSLLSHIDGGRGHFQQLLSHWRKLLRCCNHYHDKDQRQRAEDRVKGMGRRSFWDRYYQERTPSHGSFDWFLQYDAIQSTLADIISTIAVRSNYRTLNVMDIGCGTSSLAHRVAQEYNRSLHICCVDFSTVALEKLRSSERDRRAHPHTLSNVDYLAADGFNLPFRDAAFDIVFEKGTLDSVLKTPELSQRANAFVLEIVRLLKEDGMYCQFSDEDPDLRLPLLERARQTLKDEQLQNVSIGFKEIISDSPLQYFLYHINVNNKIDEAC